MLILHVKYLLELSSSLSPPPSHVSIVNIVGPTPGGWKDNRHVRRDNVENNNFLNTLSNVCWQQLSLQDKRLLATIKFPRHDNQYIMFNHYSIKHVYMV